MATNLSEEELNGLRDKAAGWYLGLWNLLIKAEAPHEIIIDASINNLLAVLDQYMPTEGKVEVLEKVLQASKEEHANSTKVVQ